MKDVGTLKVAVIYQPKRDHDWYIAVVNSRKTKRIRSEAKTARQAVEGLVSQLKAQNLTGTLRPVLKVSKSDYERRFGRRIELTHRRDISRAEVAKEVVEACRDGTEVAVDLLVDVYFDEVGQIRDGLRGLSRPDRLSWLSLRVRQHDFEIALEVYPETSSSIRIRQARRLAAMAVNNLMLRS